jgi:hypothetical protein
MISFNAGFKDGGTMFHRPPKFTVRRNCLAVVHGSKGGEVNDPAAP